MLIMIDQEIHSTLVHSFLYGFNGFSSSELKILCENFLITLLSIIQPADHLFILWGLFSRTTMPI